MPATIEQQPATTVLESVEDSKIAYRQMVFTCVESESVDVDEAMRVCFLAGKSSAEFRRDFEFLTARKAACEDRPYDDSVIRRHGIPVNQGPPGMSFVERTVHSGVLNKIDTISEQLVQMRQTVLAYEEEARGAILKEPRRHYHPDAPRPRRQIRRADRAHWEGVIHDAERDLQIGRNHISAPGKIENAKAAMKALEQAASLAIQERQKMGGLSAQLEQARTMVDDWQRCLPFWTW